MNKVYGIKSDFSYIRKEVSRVVISYNLQQVDDEHYTWNEIYFYKRQKGVPTFEQIKEAIIEDINKNITEKITEGFEWDGAKVWLTTENLLNYKTAYDLAVQDTKGFLPVIFKFGTNDEPTYCTFETLDALKEFYIATVDYITDCISEAWELKDSVNWDNYKE